MTSKSKVLKKMKKLRVRNYNDFVEPKKNSVELNDNHPILKRFEVK